MQGYNSQAVVDTDSMLIVQHNCVQAANDKQQVEPMLEALQALPQQLDMEHAAPIQLVANTGYFSQANVEQCEDAGIVLLIAQQRESHSGWLDRRLAPPPSRPDDKAPALEKMRYRLVTPEGQATYALRKCTVEPVFGIITQVMRYRQFLVRGLHNVKGEWGLVCLAFNIKRLAVLKA